MVSGFDSHIFHQCWAGSLMVKQWTHNSLSLCSIHSQPTSAPMDKLGKSSLSKGEILWVRISLGVPRYCGCSRIGIGNGLKIHNLRVRVPSSAPYGISIMDNTVGFYPTNVGSIPACRTRDKCRWNQLDRYWIANPWKQVRFLSPTP